MAYYLFSLPPELIDTLTPRFVVEHPAIESQVVSNVVQAPTARSKTCTICFNASFLDVDAQRIHFRSDWHRYNVKLRLSGATAVTEPEFAALVEGLEDSLSGSASSSDDASSSNPDAIDILLAKSHISAAPSSPTSEVTQPPRTALMWFHSPPSTQIGLYRALFPTKLPPTSYLAALKDMQLGGVNGRRWTMLMIAGGHFAGVIVQVRRPDDESKEEDSNKGSKKKKPTPYIEVLRHKTFHRYTTRRKQGGSQSVNDNAKGPAKSAGAQLRRYGEQALREDIRNLLADWTEDIASSELIWIRASVSNRRIFYDYDGAVFRKDDERLRKFPFPTRRPTQAELTRCLTELTRPKVSHLTEEALRAQDDADLTSLKPPKAAPPTAAPVRPPSPKVTVPSLTKEEEALRDKWRRITEMVVKSRWESFKTLWDREGASLGGINTRVPERGLTILQLAAAAGQEEMVHHILEDLRADPTISVTESTDINMEDAENASDTSDAPPPILATSRRTAYDLARTLAVRNVFRRCAAAHPEWWDWLGKARVPSVLSPEMEEERERRKDRRRGLKEKLRERQANQEIISPAVPETVPVTKSKTQKTPDGPRRLGGTGGQEGIAGLSNEMRAKVERERRARAAEARLKALKKPLDG